MSPSRHDPIFMSFTPVLTLRRELDRLLSSLLRDVAPDAMDEIDVSIGPRLEAEETTEGFRLEAALPGIDPDAVKIVLSGNTLSITLPDGIDASRIQTTLRDGVLSLELREAA